MTDTSQPPQENSSGFMRIIYIALGIFMGVIFLIFVLAVVAAVLWGDGQFGDVVSVIRDIMFVFLALEGILIVFALVILIAQVSRLVNLVQNEIKPILENTQETVSHARGTVEFVGKNLAEPVMTANRFVAAAGGFTREIFRMRRVLGPSKTVNVTVDNDNTQEASHDKSA